MDLPTPAQTVSRQKPPQTVFFAVVVIFFVLGLSAAHSIGFVPYYLDGSAPRDGSVALQSLPELTDTVTPASGTEMKPNVQSTNEKPVYPTRLRISAINLDVPIVNPDTRDIAALDEYLAKAPVRYVDSARLAEDGNILIFGHSSHLAVVHNQMYKVFNGLPELSAGDMITLTGDGNDYLYRISNVRKTDANEEVIDLSKKNGRRLTISTCDNFGAKTSRWVVEAEYVGMAP